MSERDTDDARLLALQHAGLFDVIAEWGAEQAASLLGEYRAGRFALQPDAPGDAADRMTAEFLRRLALLLSVQPASLASMHGTVATGIRAALDAPTLH